MKWETVKLSDISQIGDGAHASLKRVESGIPYLTAKNITKSGIDYSTLNYISEETYQKHFKESSNALTCPKEDDILYSIIGSIGGVYRVQNEVLGISSSVAIFRPKQELVLSDYLTYYLKSSFFDVQVNAIKGGVAQGFLSLSKLGSISITIPNSIEYQQKIVSILSAYDDLIENNQKQIKLLEEAAQRLYKEWFVDLRFPGHEHTAIVDGVPEGWRKGRIEDIAIFKRGKTITKSQVSDGIIPVVAGGLEPAYFHNQANTVAPVITISGSGANAGYTRIYFEDVFASDCSFVDSKTTNNLYYIYCFLKTSKESIDALQKGSAQPHVYAKDINAMELLIPTNDVFERFNQLSVNVFGKIGILQKQNKELIQARDRLLPKLMSGEIIKC